MKAVVHDDLLAARCSREYYSCTTIGHSNPELLMPSPLGCHNLHMAVKVECFVVACVDIDVCPEYLCLISQNGHNYTSFAVVKGHVMKQDNCEIGLG